jgi:hypothetical protein
MINIKKFDSVALAVKDVLQQEALKGDQHKIDKNKNNKIDAHDFKILRGEKPEVKKEEVENVEEGNNPFDYKNYKSQLPTKPGEKAGFDSKKISTGTVYTRKPVKDEPMKKESAPAGASVKGSVASISKAATQGIGSTRHANNALMEKGKEIKKEEVEQIDELSKSTLGSYVKSAARDVGASRSLGADFKNKAEKSRKPSAKAASSRLSDRFNAVAQKRHAGIGKAVERLTKEEIELDERTLTKGETAEKERIVKGMKKNLAGFKSRYGERAKSVMYATATKSAKNEEFVTEAKRPESDTVPFITNGDSKPLQHAKDLAKKSLKRLKSEMMGKTGTSE